MGYIIACHQYLHKKGIRLGSCQRAVRHHKATLRTPRKVYMAEEGTERGEPETSCINVDPSQSYGYSLASERKMWIKRRSFVKFAKRIRGGYKNA